ncbi:hypothetical protein AQF52_2757 [Streptomyces venezuelae]|nr:hypothetical protein AQF52_2757 [Streptomyces venezuelae]
MDRHPGRLLQLRRVGDRRGAADEGGLAHCVGLLGSSIKKDGRLSNATPGPAGRGSAYDYRPSPRQLRRSSPKRMMCRSLAEGRRRRTSRFSMRDGSYVKADQ